MAGKVRPETENPVPLIVAEFTVTDAVPVEDSVMDCVDAVFTFRLPKARLAVFTLRVATERERQRAVA